MDNSSPDRPAHGLNFRYWLRDLLFSGSQGVVYQAHDISLNRACSVKVLDVTAKDNKSLEQRFVHEAEILAGLSHPNIIESYECTRDEQGNLFSVMEPLDGRDLRSLLAEVSSLPLEQTLDILRAVGAGLQHAHDLGIVHQDINPSSIFLNKERGRTALAVEVVKVMNFGLARRLTLDVDDQERNLHLGLVFSAPTYLAPEELELSSERVDCRSDQWSLAVLAYQMLSGQLPYWEIDPWCLRELIRGAAAPVPLSDLMPELPAYVLGAIHKAMSKDKDQRYANIGDFIAALDGLPASASKQTKPELRSDLIAQCRPASSLLAAVHSPLPTETQPREYPALSFPAELLASADGQAAEEQAAEEQAADAQPVPVPIVHVLPEPKLTPPWTAGKIVPRQRGVDRKLWLLGCLIIALAPAPVVAALHYLHPVSHGRGLRHPSQLLPAPSSPAVVVAAPPLVVLPQALPASPVTHPGAHKNKLAPSHHAHLRAVGTTDFAQFDASACPTKIKPSQAQAVLAEGLGI